jgi:hypothetical protein
MECLRQLLHSEPYSLPLDSWYGPEGISLAKCGAIFLIALRYCLEPASGQRLHTDSTTVGAYCRLPYTQLWSSHERKRSSPRWSRYPNSHRHGFLFVSAGTFNLPRDPPRPLDRRNPLPPCDADFVISLTCNNLTPNMIAPKD